MGNGILQSGAAIGAIITPLVVLAFLTWTDTWRYPFLVVGGVGVFWVILWWALIRREDLALPTRPGEASPPGETWWQRFRTSVVPIWADRRFWVLVVLVVSINAAWHFFRAWMPLYLEEDRDYSKEEVMWFTSAYYLATDLGSLCAGFVTLALVRRGVPVHRSRVLVFFGCALLTSLSVVAANLATGPWLLVVLLVIGFGALGLFPNYYSFSQEITVRHQGKVTGMLGCSCWLAMALLHHLVGENVEETGDYSLGVALAGLAPLVGLFALVFLWGKPAPRPEMPAVAPEGGDHVPRVAVEGAPK